jgi:hypothetical protein
MNYTETLSDAELATVAAGGVSVAMLVLIYQIVRSDRLSARMAPPVQASATVDGRPVRNVEVLQ